jgi:hypothetical protein
MDIPGNQEMAFGYTPGNGLLLVYTGYLVRLGILRMHRLALDDTPAPGIPRSSIPPCPGKIVPESFRFKLLFISDLMRPPKR